MGKRNGGSGSGAWGCGAPPVRSAETAAMPGAADRSSELSEQIEAFVARLRGGGERPRSEDTARQTLSLLRKIIAHGQWSCAGEGRAAAGRARRGYRARRRGELRESSSGDASGPSGRVAAGPGALMAATGCGWSSETGAGPVNFAGVAARAGRGSWVPFLVLRS